MKKILIITFLSCFFIQFIQAQETEKTISETITFSEENSENSDFTLKEKYDYFVRADIQEKTLVKLALFRTPGLLPGAGVETKLSPQFSLNVFSGPSVGLMSQTIENEDGSTTYNTKWGIDKVRTTIGVRYYFDIMRRIKAGESANNFSANYIGYQTNHLITPGYEGFQESRYQFKQTFVFGIQRRMGDIGYIDFNVGGLGILGFLLSGSNLQTVINFQVGFGF